MSFISYQINKALKHVTTDTLLEESFISYQINKALKLQASACRISLCFISYQINKALKPQIHFEVITEPYILRNVVN